MTLIAWILRRPTATDESEHIQKTEDRRQRSRLRSLRRGKQKSEVRSQRAEGALLSLSPGARRWPKRRPATRKIVPTVPHNAECKSQNCVAGIFSRKPPIQPTRLFAAKK